MKIGEIWIEKGELKEKVKITSIDYRKFGPKEKLDYVISYTFLNKEGVKLSKELNFSKFDVLCLRLVFLRDFEKLEE